ncbi:hypothetical protein FRB95_014403 [Tulasnella sp. JGI-2019a]|nr:hypothetical protein FRB95_014403 [Tulasnella sp. JGI-2019a]
MRFHAILAMLGIACVFSSPISLPDTESDGVVAQKCTTNPGACAGVIVGSVAGLGALAGLTDALLRWHKKLKAVKANLRALNIEAAAVHPI